MSWKSVGAHDYLYRKRRDVWTSLGPREPETETTYRQFHAGRTRLRETIDGFTERLDAMAPINRAMQLGRLPLIAARILRALHGANLLGPAVTIVGTNALYAYERMAGVRIAGDHLATGDIDLLFDARRSLRLLAPEISTSGIAGLLRKLDRSFEVMGKDGFRAVNRDGYMVDLIMPAAKDRMAAPKRSRVGSDIADLQATEIEGLSWLVNSPKAKAVVIDVRGYPLHMAVPDPRAFALHKRWLSRREDRDPLKRRRDAAQADLVAGLVATYLPHLRFDDPALGALPVALREEAGSLVPKDPRDSDASDRPEPGW